MKPGPKSFIFDNDGFQHPYIYERSRTRQHSPQQDHHPWDQQEKKKNKEKEYAVWTRDDLAMH